MTRPVLLQTAAVAALALALGAAQAGAQADGTLDPDFGVGGIVLAEIPAQGTERGAFAGDLAVLADGRVLAAGVSRPRSSLSRLAFLQLLPDGARDPEFGENGIAVVAVHANAWMRDARLALGPGGEIYGMADLFVGVDSGWAVVRLLADGSPDPAFGDDGVVLSLESGRYSGDIAVQEDGKVLVAGTRTRPGPAGYEAVLCRYLIDGALDLSVGAGTGCKTFNFGAGAEQQDQAFALAVQADGKILVAGAATVGVGDYEFAVARLDPSFAFDASFGAGGRTTVSFDHDGSQDNDFARALAVDRDGRILVAGKSYPDVGVARLSSTGALDSTFGQGGGLAGRRLFRFGVDLAGGEDELFGMTLQSDGKILLSGEGFRSQSGGLSLGVARLDRHGDLDPLFSGDGRRIVDFDHGPGQVSAGKSVAVASDGACLVAGGADFNPQPEAFAVLRFNVSLLFADNFQTGDTSAWSTSAP